MTTKHISLWDRDIVEAMIATDPARPKRYTEFEIAPTNEKLDLSLDLPERDFSWSSGFETGVSVNKKFRRWTCVVRIPLKSLAAAHPQAGTKWRINFYRCDRANKAFLAWSPTLSGTFHTPERFGVLEFAK
jgi:hypothetical protein